MHQGKKIGFLYLDVSVNELSNINLKINDGWNSFIYVYEGQILSNLILKKGQLGVLDTKGSINGKSSLSDTKFIVVAGAPLNDPVARGGPFVMNTEKEVLDAFDYYQAGRIG